MKLATVNVVELVGGNVCGLTAFPESPEGNKAAEEHLVALIKEYDEERATDEIIAAAVEDGRYAGSMNYEVLITHSNTGPKLSAG